MRISRIFVKEPLALNNSVSLNLAANHYVKHVLRLKSGAHVILFNGKSNSDFNSRLEYSGKQAIVTPIEEISSQTDSQTDIEIIQGLCRSDHLDWTIQKCTELGVSKISIFGADHTQNRLKTAQIEKKMAHWRAISIKACEQSGRHFPPLINLHDNLQLAVTNSTDFDTKILLNFDGKALPEILNEVGKPASISILLGPEGGLSKNEIEIASKSGFIFCRLGPRVLRTETAAITALAIVQSFAGDLSGQS